jgi:6-phosphogluconate dehydrogenase
MGRSLAQNFTRNGYLPVGFDPYPNLPDDFAVEVVKSIEEFVGTLTPPRTFSLMVPAGAPADGAIASLNPNFSIGDLITDGGNADLHKSLSLYNGQR